MVRADPTDSYTAELSRRRRIRTLCDVPDLDGLIESTRNEQIRLRIEIHTKHKVCVSFENFDFPGLEDGT